MRQFSARELFETNYYKWPLLENETFVLEFEDASTMQTNTARTEVSRKLWLQHEKYPRLGIFKRHHIGNGPLSNARISDVLSAIVEDIHDTYGEGGYNREEAWRWGYYAQNRLYNESIVEYAKYVRGANSFDFGQLYLYPSLKEIRDRIRANPTPLMIEKGYDDASLILKKDPAIARNPIVSALRAGLVKMEQLLQILIVRGHNTDIDSHIYERAILGNFYDGILDPAEAMMESTLASKAIIFTGQPLEQTEYANRKMQFTSQQVDLLVMNDCGSRRLEEIEITKGRFQDMLGLFFFDEVKQQFVALRSWHEEELVGTTQRFRLAFNCAYRHHNCVCKVCYGLLAYNLPYGTNIGHVASTMTQSEVSQRVLKVKHSEASTVSDPIVIQESERPYILPGGAPNEIRLNPRLGKLKTVIVEQDGVKVEVLQPKGIKLLLRSTPHQGVIGASKLPILKRADVQRGVSVAKFSQFRDVTFEVPAEKGKALRYHVSVSRGTRQSYLTHQFLRFFLDQEFKIHDDGYYHIDLDKWDFDQPVFEMPNRHTSMKDFAAEVEVMIRSSRESSQRHLGKLKQLTQYDNALEALLDLHELISSKVPVAFTHVCVVMLSMMVSRNNNGDMRIPPLDEPAKFAKYDAVINGRSLGPLFAYQGGKKALEDMDMYMLTDRPSHLLDPLLLN